MINVYYGILKIAVWVLRLIYIPLKLLPTQKKITFISRQANKPCIDFVLLSDAIQKEHPECKVVIHTKKTKNIILYCFNVLQQMYHIATSKTVIIERYCIPVCVLKHKKSLCVLQIWHALGSMKHFGYDMLGKEEGHAEKVADIMCMHKNYTYILISSYYFIKDFLTGFRVDASCIKEIPLPKADCLTSEAYKKEKREYLLKKYPKLADKKNILYCPTYRKFPSDMDGEKINALINQIDFEKYNLIYSAHPLSRVKVENPNVMLLEEGTFDALFISDYVISDYSSVIYEAGLLKIPVYLYAYDWENYHEKRTFNLDLEKEVPTIFTGNPEKIVEAIECNQFDAVAFEEFTNKNVRLPKESCCKEILKLIKF